MDDSMMQPPEIYADLLRSVLGQDATLKYVSVAIFKHLQGEPFGNLMLIGNSGTGKTTTMRAMEELYGSRAEFERYRCVIILNANVLANEEGTVDATPLLARLEERARQIAGDDATGEEIANLMQHATVCIDEVDKVSSIVGGRPFVTGINIQQALLTLIEGERILHPLRTSAKQVTIDTSKMLFLCAGAFERPILFGDNDNLRRRKSPHSRTLRPRRPLPPRGPLRLRHAAAVPVALRQRDHSQRARS